MRELTASEQETLELLGDFRPTVNVLHCEIKGRMIDSDGDPVKVYFNSTGLRELATDLNSIAQWLDERATEHENEQAHAKSLDLSKLPDFSPIFGDTFDRK